MVYTKYMIQCCQELTERKEYDSDVWIEPMLRLSALTSRVGEAYNYHNPSTPLIRGEAAIHFTTNSLLRELSDIERILPARLGNNSELPEPKYLCICIIVNVNCI